MNCQQLEKFIHAHHDGELDIAASIQVDEHLADCPRCLGRSQNLTTLRGALRNEALRFKAPSNLRQRIRSEAAQAADGEREVSAPPRGLRHGGWMVAAAVVVAGLIAVFQFPKQGREDRLVAELTENHVRSLMANHLMDVASTDQHTVKPWFDGKLDFAPPVKDFREAGFPLIGGRLDVVDGHPAAALIYGRQKHIINVFVWPEKSGPSNAVRAKSQNGYHAIRWSNGEMAFWAVSDLNETEMLEFAKIWFGN